MAIGIGRRQFIAAVGGAAVAWPLAARAQQPGKLPVIGYIAPTNPLIPSRNTGAFLQRLRELGWIEGQTITVEFSLGGRTPRTTRRDCRRVRPDQSRSDRHVIN